MEEKFRKKIGSWGLVIMLSAMLVFLYSYLALTAPGHFTSPDENANYYFARLFADKHVLHFFDPANLYSPGNAFPRSMRVAGDFTVPVGFVGGPILFGSAAIVLGHWAIQFVTPVLSLLAVIGWFLLVRRYFGNRAGLVAAGLLAVHPIWWYETARTMQPNVMFVSLVIWSAYFWLVGPMGVREDRAIGRLVDALLAGTLLGLAVAVRTSEAYWLAILFLFLLVANWSRAAAVKAVTGVVTALAVFAPFLFINRDLYGSFLRTGYAAAAGSSVADGGLGMRLIGPLQPYLFPLGFAPRTALAHFWSYGVNFLPSWSFAVVLSGLGLIWLARKRRPTDGTHYGQWVAVGALVAGWLVLFYGSWTVRDNPDPSAVTIGSSYFRYWLPILVLSTVPVAVGLVRLSAYWPWRRLVALGAASLYLMASAYVAFFSPGEGLHFVRREIGRYAEIVRSLDETLPDGAVVIVDSADKYVFPTRSVVQPFRSEHARQALSDYQRHLPVYYYGITLPAEDYAWLRDTSLPQIGLTVEPVRSYGHETLYHFYALSETQNEQNEDN